MRDPVAAEFHTIHEPKGDKIARYLEVPGGRLYQLAERFEVATEWSPPVFVPSSERYEVSPPTMLFEHQLRQRVCKLASDLTMLEVSFAGPGQYGAAPLFGNLRDAVLELEKCVNA